MSTETLTDEQWRELSDCCTNGPTCDRCAGPIAARIISRQEARLRELDAERERNIRRETAEAAAGPTGRLAAIEDRVAKALAWADDGLEGDALAYHMVEELRGPAAPKG